MRFSTLSVLALVCLGTNALAQTEEKTKSILHQYDETPVVKLKADPTKYLGQTIILCGGIAVDDYYNYAFQGQEYRFYSLSFHEVGKDSTEIGHEELYLYLPKERGATVIEAITQYAASDKGARKNEISSR